MSNSPLPIRTGPRPRTTPTNPHSQLTDIPASTYSAVMLERIAQMEGVTLAPSGRAPKGTYGAYLSADMAKGPQEAFLLPLEFAHLHPAPDASYHLTLPEPLRAEAIAAGWAEAHPLAGQPTVSANIVMVYAPRDETEVETVMYLVAASRDYAAGVAAQQD
jgi:hypothetical protein